MDTRLKNRWVKALRSGKYSQGTESLCYTEGKRRLYCPQGVLSELIKKSKAHKPKHWNFLEDGWCQLWIDSRNGHMEVHSIPYEVCRLIGLSGYDQDRIETMNDTLNVSFDVIAYFIEKEL